MGRGIDSTCALQSSLLARAQAQSMTLSLLGTASHINRELCGHAGDGHEEEQQKVREAKLNLSWQMDSPFSQE